MFGRAGLAESRAGLRVASLALALMVCMRPGFARAEPPAGSTVPPAINPPVPLLAYVVGAIGLSGLSVAATTGFLALNQKGIAEDHCSATVRLCDATGRAANDTGRTLRDVSTTGWIIGGLGLGLSAYLLLTTPSPRGDIALTVLVDGARPQAGFVAHF